MYLLDTNVLSELIRLRPDPLVETRFETEIEALFTSVICVEEIRYGAKIGPPGNRLWERSQTEVLPRLTILALDEALAIAAADLRAEWKIGGKPTGYRDGLIAATAKTKGLILVTRNTRHFDHVTGLQVQNWFEPPPPPAAAQPSG
jgi:predicted nucleic acid-binding protein